MISLRVLEIAEAEALEAALWHDARSSGLGRDFVAKYEQALSNIERFPNRYPLLETTQTDREHSPVHSREVSRLHRV